MKTAIAVAASCMALTGVTLAGEFPRPEVFGKPCHVERIPLNKRAEPTVRYTVTYQSWRHLQTTCETNHNTPDNMAWGCARLDTSPMQIFIDAALSDDMKACVLLHEKAHLPPNNWVHPD